MPARYGGLLLSVLVLAGAGCASPSKPAVQGGASARPGPAQPRTLMMVINSEVSNLSPKAIGPTNPRRTTRIFNADLTLTDVQGNENPDLAEALPLLKTSTWQVFSDGRMETTWKLQPGLTWHDGQPLTAEDFLFALRVYQAPELRSSFGGRPQNIIDQIVAVDSRTFRIHWRSPFLHKGEGLTPLPRHILGEPFAAFEQDRAGQAEAFMALRFWTIEYVGAGPYRLTHWEPASHLEGEAFDGHALGRPRIDRIVIRLINNENTALANIMAGEFHLSLAQAIQYDQAIVLRDQAGFNDLDRKGRLVFIPASLNTLLFQHRPQYAQAPGLLDVRVRKALIHAIDREAINERLFENQAPVPISFVYPGDAYYGEVDPAITRYPYDPKRSEQLLTDAGYARDREGLFVDSGGQRLQPALWNTSEQLHRTAAAILLHTWKGAGIDVQPFVMPTSLQRDQEARSTFPGMLIGGGINHDSLATAEITSAATRWNGANRGGWSNADYDLLWERYQSTVDLAEQTRSFVGMMKLHSELVPNYPLHFNLQVVSHAAAVKGPEPTSVPFNIHRWEWQ